MRYVLGINAAWTEKEPTGAALLAVNENNSIELVKIARSYEEFLKDNIQWNDSVSGSRPDLPGVCGYCKNNGWDIDLIALDIPLAPERIKARRECDSQISRNYGKYGASTHSPNEERPGVISEIIFRQLSESGFDWNGDAEKNKSFIEVYPHTAIIELFKCKYRFPYKVQKRLKYWPKDTPEQRYKNIVSNLNELRAKLISYVPNLPDILHELSFKQAYPIKYLKGYEDVLDAIVCALAGCFYIKGKAEGYGNNTGTIWVPKSSITGEKMMISKAFIELLYDAASIQRWNDHIRPGKGFTELDKQAHKMIIAFVLAKYEEEDRNIEIDWLKLIDGCIFEFLYRVVLTDIKPPIFHRLMEKSGDKLNVWVLEQLDNCIESIEGDFNKKFSRYLFDKEYAKIERKILKAAHYLATDWEFKIIYNMNTTIYGLEDTKKQIENELEEHYDLAGVQKLGLGRKTSNFTDLVGQLRFQQRWTRSPRLPETSVMGHMLIVVILTYLFSYQIEACDKRLVNNFLAGLFHDLPEVLTRDIVSPVKKSVVGLEAIIKDIEGAQLEEKLFPLIPKTWQNQMRYLMQDEFSSKIVLDGNIRLVSSEDINLKYNQDSFNPVDGEIIRACDHLSAFIEAYLSISHGISSKVLKEGYASIFENYKDKYIVGINITEIFNFSE